MNRPRNSVVPALDLCLQLDRMVASEPDYLTEDTLNQIGQLMGGVSDDGFHTDFGSHLTGIEDRILADAHRSDYDPARGGNDPDFYISGALEDQIGTALDNAAWAFLEAATALLKPLTHPALVRAAA